ncbi:hypothetical protein [Streptomyces sp. NRRL WC-3744]|uniref:hypothetical protein n=1 Tax=Streptomyces sp. NRRL WC-3744 TaxID=1463935 RepID=UPI0004CBD36B|nr:hypothetical protein [Streptomyces sp. NRRL WC-3744]
MAEAGEERYARGAEPGSVECRADGAVRRPGRGERDEAPTRLGGAPTRLGEAAESGDRIAAQARHGVQTIRHDLEMNIAEIADRDPGSTAITLHEIREALQRVGHEH